MNHLVVKENYEVIEKKGQAITSSRNVSEIFGKRHDNILQMIKKLDCSAEFSLLNFKESNYKDVRGKTQPEYLMTKDGFVFLVMGFTGKKAAAFKEGYIKQFNQMEKILQQKATDEWQEARKVGKTYQIQLNDTIQKFVEYAKLQGSSKPAMYYKHFASFSNKSVDIKDGQRDLSESRQLQTQSYVIDLIKRTIEEGMLRKASYKEIYVICKSNVSGLLSYISPLQITA